MARPQAKSLSAVLACGCRFTVTYRLDYRRTKICDQHRQEKRLRTSVDTATLDGTAYRNPSTTDDPTPF